MLPHDASRGLDWAGFWPGRVVDVNDPDRSGRIRVRVEQPYGNPAAEDGEIQDTQLPWAFPMFHPGVLTGEYHVPPVGAQVWVGWFGSSPEYPIWIGGSVPAAELPAEFSGSYEGTLGPKTRFVKNAGLQVFEMRWKTAEEEIRLETATGVRIRIVQADALGGPKILLETPSGFRIILDQKLQQIQMATPSGRLFLLDDVAQLARLATASQSLELLDASGAMNLVATSTMALTAPSSITITTLALILNTAVITVAAALALTAVGLLTLTGAGVVIATTAAAVAIGSLAGAKKALVNIDFLTAAYDVHGHGGVTTGAGVSGVPTVLSAPGHTTTNTLAD